MKEKMRNLEMKRMKDIERSWKSHEHLPEQCQRQIQQLGHQVQQQGLD